MSPASHDQLRRDFESRIEPHGPALLRFVRRLLLAPSDAADVLQTSLANAYQVHRRFDRESSFKAWIYRFATHEALNANRRTRRDAHVGLDDEADPRPWPADLELELAYEKLLADPDAVLTRLDGPLARALSDLAPRMRAAFLLRSLGDFSCGEIAAILEIPKGTVVSWLFRARARLRRELAEYARRHGLLPGVR